jgi:hypothetical protein
MRQHLESRDTSYVQMYGARSSAWSYDLPIGEEPEMQFFLGPLEISRSETPTDTLREIKIQKIGHCL